MWKPRLKSYHNRSPRPPNAVQRNVWTPTQTDPKETIFPQGTPTSPKDLFSKAQGKTNKTANSSDQGWWLYTFIKGYLALLPVFKGPVSQLLALYFFGQNLHWTNKHVYSRDSAKLWLTTEDLWFKGRGLARATDVLISR